MSLLIKNAIVVDGLGQSPYRANLLVKSGHIASICSHPSFSVSNIIDATDQYVSPGFINANSDADFNNSFLHDRHQTNHLQQGITTAIIGHHGRSPAPILGSANATIFGQDSKPYNLNWGTFADFRRALSNHRFGTHFHSLVGVNNLKLALDQDLNEAVSNSNLLSLANLVTSSILDGAFGVSFDFRSDTPLADHRLNELQQLASATFINKGIVSLSLPPAEDDRRRLILTALREKRKAGKGKLFITNASIFDLDYLTRSQGIKESILHFTPTSTALLNKLVKVDNVILTPSSDFLKAGFKSLRFNIQDVIAKITSNPAKILNLKHQPSIKEGVPADLVIFDKQGQIKTVLVNGQPSIHSNTNLHYNLNGRLLC